MSYPTRAEGLVNMYVYIFFNILLFSEIMFVLFKYQVNHLSLVEMHSAALYKLHCLTAAPFHLQINEHFNLCCCMANFSFADCTIASVCTTNVETEHSRHRKLLNGKRNWWMRGLYWEMKEFLNKNDARN